MKNEKEFYKELEDTLHDRIGRDHPLIEELFKTGDVNMLRMMVTQGYQLTKVFAIYVGGLYYRCPIAKHRKRFAMNVYEEETGKISRTNGHLELLHKFTSAIGLSQDDLNLSPTEINSETQELIDYRFELIEDPKKFHQAVAAVMIASEGQNLEDRVGESRRELVAKGFGLELDDMIFFKVHAEEDVYHVRDGLRCCVDVCTTEEMQREAVQAIHETCDRFDRHYDGIFRKYKEQYQGEAI
ncbi:MAG: pyrroloquinoline-quinone synthase [Cyclobacteriaceae bacterium]|jgi:pyrroloquinoline-quinone synthase